MLYLAKYGSEDRSRAQIMADLQLDMEDGELETRLHKLRMADLISRGSSFYHYKGLGDPIFELVFRKAFGNDVPQHTGYLLYSENGFTPEQESRLQAAGAMYSHASTFTSYERELYQHPGNGTVRPNSPF